MITENAGTAMSADAQSSFKNVVVRRAGVVLSSAAVAVALVGCGAVEDITGSGGGVTATETVTETATEKQAAESSSVAQESDLREVDPEKFSVGELVPGYTGTEYAFLFELDGQERQCMFNEVYVRCDGTPGPEIPDLAIADDSLLRMISGEDTTSANHIYAGRGGLTYEAGGNFVSAEAEDSLEPGEWFEFGHVTCAAVDDSTLTCTVDGEGFTLTGKEALISTTTEPNNDDFVE